MASWGGAEEGASAGAATGNPWLIAAGALLGGLFGRREEYTPAQKLQMQIAQQMQQYAGSVPLSDPQEQSALAEQRGFLGQEQRQDLGTLMSMSPNLATTGAGGQADLLKNMTSAQTGQRMALSSQALMNALLARRRALMESAQVAQGVGQPRQTPGIGGDLANLMRAYSQYQAQQGGQQGPYGQGSVSGFGNPAGNPTGSPMGGVGTAYGASPQVPASAGLQTPSTGASNPFQPPSTPQQGQGPGGNPFQQDFSQLMNYGPRRSPANGPWQAGMNNFTNGMGQWPMQMPDIAAGYGIPSSSGVPDYMMGGGNPYSIQAMLQGLGR